MFGKAFRALACLFAFMTLVVTGGVYAVWHYAGNTPADAVTGNFGNIQIMWDQEEPVLKNALMKFLRILNNIDDPNDYQTLCNIFAKGASGWTDGSYTGTVAGSTQISSVETLFDGELNMTIYDKDIRVYVLLKRENLDNNDDTGIRFHFKNNRYETGAEMVMYYTADQLKTAGKTNTPVFASVFSVRANGNSETPAEGDQWKLLATYEGTATTTNWYGTRGTGSFNTTTWRSLSTDTYTRYDNQTDNPITGAQTLATLIQQEQQAQTVLHDILNAS